ncbi:MAG TPA: lytic transglycosylase domain-containing protein [Flavisolibacter sp.]|nr:lytic transglycosylase domain-containing protein [Flavisolibacter sp.]
MLKKNLVKTVFLGYGLLGLFPVITSMKGTSGNSIIEEKPLYLTWQKADTVSQPFVLDSAGFITATESNSAAAPAISLNTNASKFVKNFLIREEESLQKTKSRSASYFKMFDEVFSKYGLPVELKYLAVVESDLKTTALSRVGAKGLWQFMPTTARDLGLKVSKKCDERTYAYKSTVAAAKYLKDLHAQFDDWLLVIAAYNAGPVPVSRAIRKSGSKNFWTLQNYLPQESRAHVKRFIGTHYYFEGKGSMVTLTKAETIKYSKELEEFKSSIQPKEMKKDSVNTVVLNRF